MSETGGDWRQDARQELASRLHGLGRPGAITSREGLQSSRRC